MVEEIKGEKIKCEGHIVQKPFPCVQSDGHHGMCTTIKHGKCELLREFRWMGYKK
jgi:hypothetical protein